MSSRMYAHVEKFGLTLTQESAPGEVALEQAVLMLHVAFAPPPQTVEDVLLIHLHGNHHAIRHALGAGIVVLDVRDVAHGVAHLEVHLVGAVEHVVEHLLQFYAGT